MKQFYVYIITNHKNTTLYTGITNNIKRRVWEHKKGLSKNSFSKKYKLYKLIWFKEFSNPKEAIVTEKRIKSWNRKKKVDLIKSLNPKLQDFYFKI